MTTDTEALRQEFERHIVATGRSEGELIFEAGHYLYPDVHEIWELYQAGYAAAKAETADVGEPDAREMFNAGWCAAARFCGREDVVYDGLVGPGGCPAFEYAYRAALAAHAANLAINTELGQKVEQAVQVTLDSLIEKATAK